MKSILFVCMENSCRSQMAEGFAKYYNKNNLVIFSAGSKPSGVINPDAIQVMKDKNIHLENQYSKGFDELPSMMWDYIVTMGCGDTCPQISAKNHINWDLPDPKNKSIDFFQTVRDDIEELVKKLLEEI